MKLIELHTDRITQDEQFIAASKNAINEWLARRIDSIASDLETRNDLWLKAEQFTDAEILGGVTLSVEVKEQSTID